MNTTGAAIGAVAFLGITQLADAVSPVTIGMRIHDTSQVHETFQGNVFGYKIKDCAVVKDSFVGWQRVEGIWTETPFSFIDDPTPNSTRPKIWGQQDFGGWQWRDLADGATDVKLSLMHNCDGSLTVTQATFKIGDAQ